MSLHNDLQKARIPHTCENCCCNCGKCNSVCPNFHPADMPRFMGYAVDYLKGTVISSRECKLKRHIVRDGRSFNDGIATLDAYYVQLINSVLCEIRKGGSDYVFSFEQIREIMRFEPNIKVRYIPDAGSYEIWISK